LLLLLHFLLHINIEYGFIKQAKDININQRLNVCMCVCMHVQCGRLWHVAAVSACPVAMQRLEYASIVSLFLYYATKLIKT